MLKLNKGPIRPSMQWAFYFLIAIGLASAMFVNYQRFELEMTNTQVEIVLDLDDTQRLATSLGLTLGNLLPQIKQTGVTSLAVPEDDLLTLEEAGRLIILSGNDVIKYIRMSQITPGIQKIMRRASVEPHSTYIIITDTFLFDRVRAALTREVGETALEVIGSDILALDVQRLAIENIGLGFSTEVLNIYQEMGFKLVPRLNTSGRLDDNKIALKLNNVSETGLFKTIIFNRDTVMGYPRHVEIVAQRMERYNFNFGYVEFGKQKGDQRLADLIPARVIKVHSISAGEMRNYKASEAVSRYVRATQERGARILYVRPWLDFMVADDLLAYNLNYFKNIVTGLRTNNFKIKAIDQPTLRINAPPTWALFFIYAAIMAAIFMFCSRYYSLGMPYQILGFLLVLAVAGCSLFLPPYLIRKLYAFLVATSAPALIILPLFGRYQPLAQSPNRLKEVGRTALTVFGGSLVAGLIIAALLRDTTFLLALRTFSGVKLAFVSPLFLVAFYLLFGAGRRAGFIFKVRRLLATPVTNVQALIAGALLVAVAFLLLRSGNSAAELVPGIEHNLRRLLESGLLARPRFKELIIGYPALVLLVHYAGRGLGQRWFGLLVLAATLVPISIINSFCHFHTPLWFSFLRSFNGLMGGLILGYLAVFGWSVSLRVAKTILK